MASTPAPPPPAAAALPVPATAKTRDQLLLKDFTSSRILDRDAKTSYGYLIAEFQRLGGVIHPGIILHFNKDTKVWTPSANLLHIPPRKHVFTVCQAGENRSQIARLALDQLLAWRKTLGLQLYLPHGAEGSVDPFILPTMTPDEIAAAGDTVDWDREMAYQYYPVSTEASFHTALKQSRMDRECEVECMLQLETLTKDGKKGVDMLQGRDPKVMAMAREFMSEHYFLQRIIRNEGFVIAFNRGVHVMLLRLVEVAHAKRHLLTGVVLQPMDSSDPVVVKAVREFATCFYGLITAPHVTGETSAAAAAAAAPPMMMPSAAAAAAAATAAAPPMAHDVSTPVRTGSAELKAVAVPTLPPPLLPLSATVNSHDKSSLLAADEAFAVTLQARYDAENAALQENTWPC